MTKLEHKDGSTVKLGFTYALTAGGQITRITHQDSTNWAYANDLRGRLSKAERNNAPGVIPTKVGIQYEESSRLAPDWIPSSEGMTGERDTWYRSNASDVIPTKVGIQYEESSRLAPDWIPSSEGMTGGAVTGGVDTNITYDDWDRLITKAQGAYQATYAWYYGDNLKRLDSNFPGETTTAYLNDGLGKRRIRVVMPDPNNSATWQYTCYRWDAGWNVIGEYDPGTDGSTSYDIGARNKTLVHQGMATLAEIDGTNPGSGTTRYYAHDHLGSARALYSSAKAELGTLEYNPYGDTYASTGTQPAYSFTGKPYDATIGMYYFPYRYYSPEMDRWISRDPLGMVDGPNLYGYVEGQVIGSLDADGLETLVCTGPDWSTCHARCKTHGPRVHAVGCSVTIIHTGCGFALKITACRCACVPCGPAPPRPPKVDYGRPHFPYGSPHLHYWVWDQTSYPNCRCFSRKMTTWWFGG